ncbi:phytanoyl-CoA dioxygenase family protein [Phenylobacterium aquaticum]|uniref:phytanoyl-CoA dioxygenase family protein n=1 Tax=Phenylobacterium aquaticum TaxID=1763816 RepID=UPI0026ED4A3C|nr:phytanoyl-CoA dioxygenase family protein [Phenylobacterium aquaticum]
MVKKYTDAEIADLRAYYEEHGVVKLTGFIEPEWVDKVLGAIDDAAARSDEPIPAGAGLSFGKADGRMTIRHQWRENPTIREFLLNPEMARVVAKIVGSKTLRFWFDLTFMHDGAPDGGKGAGTDWHHDIAAFAFKGEQLPSLWMAMTQANAERSRLMFVDGSNKSVPGYYRTPGHIPPADGSDDGYLTIPDIDAEAAAGNLNIITWDCEPGDAIILHPYVVHGASGNTGKGFAGRRVAITTRWFGDDVRYLPTHIPTGNGLSVPRQVPGVDYNPVKVGGRPDGEYFPLVWTEDMEKSVLAAE